MGSAKATLWLDSLTSGLVILSAGALSHRAQE